MDLFLKGFEEFKDIDFFIFCFFVYGILVI